MEMPILKEIVTVFGVSAVAVAACHRLKIPTIVGFLLAGLLAGPSVFSFVSSQHEIEVMAEIGVILLLFTIGIEFSLQDLLRIRRLVIVGGITQFGLTVACCYFCWTAFGGHPAEGLALAIMVGLSSTALVLKLLQSRAELDSAHGRTAFGVLIFQDIVAVPAMLLIPMLATEHAAPNSDAAWAVVKGIIIICLVMVGSLWLVPRILTLVAKTRDAELFLISVVVICFVVAFLTQQAGLSLALGALLAGLIIAESPFSHEALRHILPFQQLFTSLFFASVGMLLDIKLAFDHLPLLLGLTIAAVTIKFLCAVPAAILLGFSVRTAVLTAASLAQIGEFSFILAKEALGSSVISNEYYQMFLAVSVLSLAIAPFLVNLAPFIAKIIDKTPLPIRLHRGWRLENEMHLHAHQPITGHAIIVGYGINGQSIGLACEKVGISYLAVEMNPDTVEAARKQGKEVAYGDAASEAVLVEEGIRSAAYLIITIPDSIASRRIVELGRRLNPLVTIIVRSKFLTEKKEFKAIGADIVVAEEFEVASAMMQKLLIKNGNTEKEANDLSEEISTGIRDAYLAGKALTRRS